MRTFVLAPIVIVVTAAAGFAACRAMSIDPRVAALVTASAIAMIACSAAIVPLLLTRGADQAAVAQAGLVSTTLHLFSAVALAGVAIMKFKFGQPFTYWMMAMYATTLIVVVTATVREVKSATPRVAGAAKP